jgi:fasciclin domain-containing protein
MAASLKSSSRLPRHPEMLFWAVPGEGLLLRVLAREMFLFNPRKLRLNMANLIGSEIDPSEIQFVSDSDQLFAVSLAELGKDVDWHMKLRPADPVEIGRWWLNYDSPVNDAIASHKIRWHFNPVTDAEWRRREFVGDIFIRRCGVVREGLRLRAAAQELGCSKAAQLIAFAVHHRVLEHVVRGQGAATILLPVNAAFAKLPHGLLDHLLTQEGRREFIRFLRAHLIVAAGRRTWRDNNPAPALHALPKLIARLRGIGPTVQLPRLGTARIIGRPVAVGRHTVILINRCLASSR